jgi:hypothetical protein
MDAKYFFINDSCKWKIIEYLGAIPPYIYRTILSEAFIVESVDLCDLAAFMITSNKAHSVRISHLNFELI